MLFSLFLFGIAASAQSTLVIELNDGSVASFVLAAKPRITFNVEQMNVVSESATMEFNRCDVKNFHFESTASSIDEVSVCAQVVVSDGVLVLSGVAENTHVAVYGVNGVLEAQAILENGCCTIPLNSFPAGFYVVKHNGTAFKFLKK